MGLERDRAAKYRYRAEELRTMAEDWVDSRSRRILLDLADDYERMAETVSKIRLVSGSPVA